MSRAIPQNPQEYFNLLVRTSEEEMFPSIGPPVGQQSQNFGYGCRYRGVECRACAAGLLIPDEVYQQEMEGRQAGDTGFEWPSWISIEELETIQGIHDGIALYSDGWDHDRFVRELQTISIFRDLPVPALTE